MVVETRRNRRSRAVTEKEKDISHNFSCRAASDVDANGGR